MSDREKVIESANTLVRTFGERSLEVIEKCRASDYDRFGINYEIFETVEEMFKNKKMERLGDADEKGYSVWKNNDLELVSKIKAMNVKTDINIGDIVNHWRLKESKVISFINEKELLVYSEKLDMHDVHRLELEKELSNDHLQLINDTYKVENYFNDNFGIITDGSSIIYGITERIPNEYRIESYNEVSVAGLVSESFNLSKYQGISFESFKGRGSVSCYFNEDGNYVNRDYNLDLSNTKPCNAIDVKTEKINTYLDMVRKHIGNLDIKYDEKADIWITDDYAYKLYTETDVYEFGSSIDLKLDAIPNQGSSYYHNGYSSNGYKAKKGSSKVTLESLINRLEKILKEYFKETNFLPLASMM